MMQQLRDQATAQDELAQRLQDLDLQREAWLTEAGALRQNLQLAADTTAESTKLTHERVQGYAQQASDLKIDLSARMSQLNADVRDIIDVKLAAHETKVKGVVSEAMAELERRQREGQERAVAAHRRVTIWSALCVVIAVAALVGVLAFFVLPR